MSLTSPFPYDVPYAPETTDRATGKKVRSPYLAQELVDWFLEQQNRTNDSPEQLARTALTGQVASIATTPVAMPDLTTGTYRISVYARITTAAVTSSSLSVTISWTDGGIACSKTFAAAMTGNTTATTGEPFVLIVDIDANAAISYATTYASNGAGEMAYKLTIIVEKLPD